MGSSRSLSLRTWEKFWMHFSGTGHLGRAATRAAALFAPPHKARTYLARLTPKGYFAPSVTIYHRDFRHGKHCFVDERTVIFQRENGGPTLLGDRVFVYRDCIIETGFGGSLSIASGVSIHPRCQINAYVVPIEIEADVMIAPNCALYPYDHGTSPGRPIKRQPLTSRGPIRIGEGAWLGFGVIVLGGVSIGRGTVVGAGSIVTHDLPDNAIAVGSPARVVRYREPEAQS